MTRTITNPANGSALSSATIRTELQTLENEITIGADPGHTHSIYLTGNQTITLSGAVTGTGTTSISTTLANAIVGISNLSATGTPGATTYLRGDGTWSTPAGSSPLTTKGDLFTYSTVNVALPVGTNGQVLSSDSTTLTGLKWVAVSGTGTVTTVSVVTANGISGSVATSTTTPAITLTLGVITPTSVNGLTLASQAVGFTIAGGTTSKTLTVPLDASVSGTNTGDNSANSTYTIGSQTQAYNSNLTAINQALTTTSSPSFTTVTANLTGNASGTSANVTGIVLPLNGGTGIANNNAQTVTGSGNYAFTRTLTNTTNVTFPTTGTLATLAGSEALTNKSLNGMTVTASTGTFTLTNSKTLSVSDTTTLATNAITLGGGEVITFSASNALSLLTTGTTVMTLPAVTDTVAVLGTAQTYTATMTEKQVVWSNNAITASGNAATVPITYRLNTVTNNSAATLTITMTTTSAVDGQMTIVRVLDATAATQTITWVNTENSTVSAPTTSNGSTSLFLTVGFIYNGGTSKWRCIASA
jgi:hypothetical protein